MAFPWYLNGWETDMDMTRRGFLKFLAAIPAVAVVAAVPSVVAEVLTLDVDKAIGEDELADFYLDFDGTRLSVRSLITQVADPVPIQLYPGYHTAYMPRPIDSSLRFMSTMRAATYVRSWMDDIHSAFPYVPRQCVVLQRTGSRLSPIARLTGMFPKSVSAELLTPNFATSNIELGFSTVTFDTKEIA